MHFPQLPSRLIGFISRLSSIMSKHSIIFVALLSPGGFGGQDRVPTWSNFMTSPSKLSVSRDYHVQSGKWYKDKNGVQHEALELLVVNCANGDRGWILIERSGADPGTPPTTPSSSNISLSTVTSGEGSAQLSSKLPAIDNVTVSATRPISGSQFHPVGTFTMREGSAPLTLCDLAALLSVVSKKRPRYHLTDANCYWYAGIIVGAIEAVHNAEVTFNGEGTNAGYLGGIQIVSPAKLRKDMPDVVPAWQERKAFYREMQTTEEVRFGVSFFSARF